MELAYALNGKRWPNMNYNPNMKDETCTCIDEHYCGKSNKDNPRLKGLIDWTIDPIKSDGRETGEVQMWADMPKEKAALYAAAPELLEALKAVFLPDVTAKARDLIVKAIAKAEGK